MRQVVVEVQCSRCERTEIIKMGPAADDKGLAAGPPALEAHMSGVVVLFQDLCTPCHRTVQALLEQISKRVKGLSPDRAPKKEEPAPEAKEKVPTPKATGTNSGTASTAQLKASAPRG